MRNGWNPDRFDGERGLAYLCHHVCLYALFCLCVSVVWLQAGAAAAAAAHLSAGGRIQTLVCDTHDNSHVARHGASICLYEGLRFIAYLCTHCHRCWVPPVRKPTSETTTDSSEPKAPPRSAQQLASRAGVDVYEAGTEQHERRVLDLQAEVLGMKGRPSDHQKRFFAYRYFDRIVVTVIAQML